MKVDIFKGWTDYLNKNEYIFNVDEKRCSIFFQRNYQSVDGLCSVEIKVCDNNYCAYVKLPVLIKESNPEQVLDYIFLANANPMFAHFTYNHETNDVFCVHGTFCDTLTDEIIELTFDSVQTFLRAFYKGLQFVTEENLSARDAYEKGFE